MSLFKIYCPVRYTSKSTYRSELFVLGEFTTIWNGKKRLLSQQGAISETVQYTIDDILKGSAVIDCIKMSHSGIYLRQEFYENNFKLNFHNDKFIKWEIVMYTAPENISFLNLKYNFNESL